MCHAPRAVLGANGSVAHFAKITHTLATESLMQSNSFTTLRRFVRGACPPQERCEVCSAALGAEHPHLYTAPFQRQVICACESDRAVSVGNQAGSKLRRIPRRVRYLANFQLTDSQWDSLLIPVGMAFVFNSTPEKRMMTFYPSPAGPTESLLPMDTWQEIVQENPILSEIEPDVEALLVNRLHGSSDYFIAPIDKCFELVGLIRINWKGLSGDRPEVWNEIAAFYSRLKENATVVGEARRA